MHHACPRQKDPTFFFGLISINNNANGNGLWNLDFGFSIYLMPDLSLTNSNIFFKLADIYCGEGNGVDGAVRLSYFCMFSTSLRRNRNQQFLRELPVTYR
jgi:hypothetical protein